MFMKIAEKIVEDITIVAISGRIDLMTSKELKAALDGIVGTSPRIIIDLTDTEYVSSSGLRILMVALKEARERDGDIKLASPQVVVRNILEISGLSNLFSIHRSPKEAVDSFQSLPPGDRR
jgi:anti-sigma B factor antagonist